MARTAPSPNAAAGGVIREGDAATLRVAYFFTRFPHPTETFLQREVRGMWRLGLKPQIHSFHAGAPIFDGQPVRQFSKLRLFALPWFVALEWWRRPRVVAEFAALLFTGWSRDWLNYWENLYGAGVGVILASQLRRSGIQHVHAAWASLPAMAAWVVARLNDITFSTGAHAYDLFEHGGDWFLREKCAAAAFVHTSTEAGRRRLLGLGVPEDRVVLARRGLDRFPEWRPLRSGRRPLRVVCVARLVEKKGLLRQVGIYRHLLACGVDLEVRIIGDGPLRERLARETAAPGVRGAVVLTGHLDQPAVWSELARADVLVHTGVVTASGDRDGLPNVVPEAMAAGVLVVTARGEGVMEAISHERTGLVCDLDRPEEWHGAFVRLRDDDVLADRLRTAARAWVEEHFDAGRNAGRILARFARAIGERRDEEVPGGRGGRA
ncbi:MAG: glycosyltransferase [Opitutaceae bacterium]|nr:glycosyltransferase [Opitutaceae bacterium]